MRIAYTALLGIAGLLTFTLPASPAAAGTTYQASLVPIESGTAPGFSARGSSIKIVESGKLRLKGKIKRVVDAAGDRVTTDRGNAADDYSIEVKFFVPATDQEGAVSIPFDLKNGNGKFRAHPGSDPVFAQAVAGDGIMIEEVRVLDSSGTLIGVGGVSFR